MLSFKKFPAVSRHLWIPYDTSGVERYSEVPSYVYIHTSGHIQMPCEMSRHLLDTSGHLLACLDTF